MANNKPIDTLRDGALKTTIWEQATDTGSFYRVQLSRTFKDSKDQWQESSSFSGAELLKIARLAQKAYDRTQELRQQSAAPASPDDGRVS